MQRLPVRAEPNLDAVHAVEARDEGVRLLHHVLVVVRHDAAQELRLGLGLRLDHVPAIVRVEEELSALGVADELDEVVRAAQRRAVVLVIDPEALAQLPERLWRVVLELEGLLHHALWRKVVLAHLHEIIKLQVAACAGLRRRSQAEDDAIRELVQLVLAIDLVLALTLLLLALVRLLAILQPREHLRPMQLLLLPPQFGFQSGVGW
mmetsp:Transcript_20865/g.73625  ORF Transcript_20865/g.73625 Transcript_20865/m.73625 type:complete len:207 (-) Transcript_20865:904-1524(-)